MRYEDEESQAVNIRQTFGGHKRPRVVADLIEENSIARAQQARAARRVQGGALAALEDAMEQATRPLLMGPSFGSHIEWVRDATYLPFWSATEAELTKEFTDPNNWVTLRVK